LGLFEYSQIGILKETTVAIFDLLIRTFLYRARNYRALLHTHNRYSHTYRAVATVGTGKAEVNSEGNYSNVLLLLAARNGCEAVVQLLLTIGKAEVDLKDRDFRTPLWWAASSGHEAVVQVLLAIGKAEVNSKDNYGLTPLSWAASNGHEAVVQLLLATDKVDIESKDTEFGQTPLS
jgi:ankyrin repeat protein